jgi:hypothetical protein
VREFSSPWTFLNANKKFVNYSFFEFHESFGGAAQIPKNRLA